ncbi:Uncharacterised protein [Legionella feeleii]|uniref:Uncharacterized protein n=1 Tax=Legionella feeleii TaxID=453 RepID=A0A378IUQ6_9GAMM|nr:Uncharacterised protein [Legionella feeleii]
MVFVLPSHNQGEIEIIFYTSYLIIDLIRVNKNMLSLIW